MSVFRALIFDCDGVMAETEADGHRIAFNRAFDEEGLGVLWDEVTYGEKLKIAGGKERMRTIFADPSWRKDVGDVNVFIKKMHNRKTQIYMEMIEKGQLPGREGVQRLVAEAHERNILLAVASTSDERGVRLLLKHVVGDEAFSHFQVILAGDVVSRKKPDPEIYLLAARQLGVAPADCCVVEDSEIGYRAADSAGMKCLITRSRYSKEECFPNARLVVDSLGMGAGAVTVDTISRFFS
jgi:HAD superfamily hydrolase (TIGR01509 family)